MYEKFLFNEKEKQAQENISNWLAREKQKDIKKKVSKLLDRY